MEFFKIVDIQTNEKEIQEKLTLGNLESYCESIFSLEQGEEQCLIGGNFYDFPASHPVE